MKVTIKEIAKRANVHPATVDKVLHNRVGVSAEVRARVQAIIDELGYKPNPAGRILQKQGRIFRLAAILTDVDSMPFLKTGIEEGVAEQSNFEIQIEYHITKALEAKEQSKIIYHAIVDKVDGIIITPINSKDVQTAINWAADANIPVVTIDSDIGGTRRLCYVGMDGARASRVAGRLMGKFLRGSGQVAVISSAVAEEDNNYFVTIREQGFIGFIQENYPGIKIAVRVKSFENAAITYQKTVELLSQYSDLQGIYITCGGVYEVGRALQESGRAKDLTVLSYEAHPKILDLIRSDVIDCTLASDLHQQGALPVKLIMDYLVFGKKPECEKLFTEIRILVKESL